MISDMVTDLQALASTAAGFFPEHGQQLHSNMPMNYPQQGYNGNGPSGYYGAPNQSQSTSYGNVSYANHAGEMGTQATLENLKQGLQTIRDLFPEYQTGAFDPRSYQQVESRLAAIQQYQLPFLSGPVPQAVEAGGGSGGVASTPQYALPPMDNLRTKDDLINLDQVVSTMQSTIYDNASQIAAAGVGQPGAHHLAGMAFRSSHSPPSSTQLPTSHNVMATTPGSNHDGSPALTPPSSAMSSTSGNSPRSLPGDGVSPTTPGAMYPTLPGPSPNASGGFLPTGMAPTPTLGNHFDHEQRRRYSGGRLQKAQPKAQDAMDTSETMAISSNVLTKYKAFFDSSSPSTTVGGAPIKPSVRRKVEAPHHFSSSNLDPALGGVGSPPSIGNGEMDESAIKANEMWVNHARTIEALKTWINLRLERHEYDDNNGGEEEDPVTVKANEKGDDSAEALYPILSTD